MDRSDIVKSLQGLCLTVYRTSTTSMSVKMLIISKLYRLTECNVYMKISEYLRSILSY